MSMELDPSRGSFTRCRSIFTSNAARVRVSWFHLAAECAPDRFTGCTPRVTDRTPVAARWVRGPSRSEFRRPIVQEWLRDAGQKARTSISVEHGDASCVDIVSITRVDHARKTDSSRSSSAPSYLPPPSSLIYCKTRRQDFVFNDRRIFGTETRTKVSRTIRKCTSGVQGDRQKIK